MLEDGLEDITVPTTVVVGGRDRVVSPGAQRALAARISGARLVELPRAGHLIPHHEPARLAEIVRGAAKGFTIICRYLPYDPEAIDTALETIPHE